MQIFAAVKLMGLLMGAFLVQEPPKKGPDLSEELLASDAVVRLTVIQTEDSIVKCSARTVFKGDGLKAGDSIDLKVDRDGERRRFKDLAGILSWLSLTPEKDQSAVFLLSRSEKTWQVRFVLFGGPRREFSRETGEQIRAQDEGILKCLEIARAAPVAGALELARVVCEKAFADRTYPEVMALYEHGLPKTAKLLPQDPEGVRKIVATYHPKVVEVSRKYFGVQAGLIAWFSRLGSEEQRKAIVAALVQRHDDLDVEIKDREKRQAERAKKLEELDFPFEREQSLDDIFGENSRLTQSFVRQELGGILEPREPTRNFREEEARLATMVPRAREYLKK